MARDNGQGIFTMDFIGSIQAMPLADASKLALEVIELSAAVPSNKTKASAMIQSSRTMKNLMIGMSNFSLSHQGLKTLYR